MTPNNALASDTPDIGALQLLFGTCSPLSHGWNRIEDNDNVRYTRWAGQSPDGRKHQKNLPEGTLVFPFENASDVRIPTADEIINDTVDYLTEGFWRSMARVQGNPQTESSGQASYARKLVEWIKSTKLYAQLVEEIELHAQNGCSYGKSLLQVGWERTLGYRYHEIKMEELLEAADGRMKRGQKDWLTLFPQLILDPTQDETTAQMLQAIHAAYVKASQVSNYEFDVQELTTTRAKKAIRELRKEGVATLPLPYLCKNQPFVRARKLWEDVFIPETARDIQSAPAIFLLDYYTEAQLRAQGEAEQWDEDWLAEAIKRKGEQSEWSRGASGFNTVDPAQTSESSSLSFTQDSDSELIEVITCLRKLVDDEGVMAVYQTIYHGNILQPNKKRGGYAQHGPLDYPLGLDYPLVQWRFEVAQRALCASRGVPEVVATWQNNLKKLEDACIDRTSLETVPSILVEQIMGVDYKFGPAVQVPVRRGTMKPEAMPLPPTSKTAEWLQGKIQARADRYQGLPNVDIPPEIALTKRQKRLRAFLLSCSQSLSFCFKLMAVNLPPEQIEQITGLPAGQLGGADAIADDLLYLLTYDAQEFSPDFVAAKWKAVGEIEMTDRSGTIDPSKAIRARLRAIDPNLEQEITTDQQGASAAVFKQVKGDFDDMLKGIPPQLTENDPTAEQQLTFAQQILQVSDVYQEAMKGKPMFQKLVEAWVQSKQHSVQQLGVNKQSGRVGVDMSKVMEMQASQGGNTRT